MDSGKVSISAVCGPCSGLTSGSEPATTYSCDKHNSAVMGVYGDPHVLSADQLSRLIAEAVGIETLAGYYQDIEWTFAAGVLYILQARPVTAFRMTSDPSDWEDKTSESPSARVLESDVCPPPLNGELVAEAGNQSGACAYSYGMQ